MAPSITLKTFSRLSYLLLVIITGILALASCVFLLSQAVRTAPNRDFHHNFNALVIGAMYILIFFFSFAFCLKRRISMHRSLAKIPRSRIAVGKGDAPKTVRQYIDDEFLRSCAIFSASQPKVPFREGWGTPGTPYEGVRFRTEILKTVPDMDAAARLVIPSMPPLRPNSPIAHHLRYIRSLITADEDGEIYFHDYTSAVHKARYMKTELAENEYERALEAFNAMKKILFEFHRLANTQV